MLLAAASKAIQLYDVSTGNRLRTMPGHEETINDIAFSPDGTTLATASDDSTVALWDVTTGKRLHTFGGHTGQVYAVTYSPDGRTLLSGGDELILWDVTTGKALRTVEHAADSLAYAPDGAALAVAGGYRISLWSPPPGNADWPEPEVLDGHRGTVHGLVFSPDGRTLASASHDDTLRLWDLSLLLVASMPSSTPTAPLPTATPISEAAVPEDPDWPVYLLDALSLRYPPHTAVALSLGNPRMSP